MSRKPTKQEQEELESVMERLSLGLYASGQSKSVKGASIIRTHPTLPLAILHKGDRTRKADAYRSKIADLFKKSA